MQKLPKKKEDPAINRFKGYYQFLSIDYKANVYYQGFMYSSVATAFQAARTNDINLRRRISELKDQQQFKKIVAEIKTSPDWATRRLNVMTLLNRDKFKRNKDLGLKLIATQNRYLTNGYDQGGDAEAFWGAIQRNGQYQGLNTLGKILNALRQQMRLGMDNKNWINQLNLQKDQDLWPQVNLLVEKQGQNIDNLKLVKKNAYYLGNHQLNDFRLDHASISKFHACIYFSTDMEVVLVDLNSSHGTFIERQGNCMKLQILRPQSLQNNDVIRFGMSTRRYIVYFSYDEVQKRLNEKQRKAKQQLQRIQKLKKLETPNQSNQTLLKNAIKSLLELKDYACLYVQNVNRNFNYKDIKEIFNKYGLVKNVRINIDQKTGRFMGNVLVYYDEKVKVREVLQSISNDPIKLDFKVVAVNQDQAIKIIASFAGKQKQQQKPRKLEQTKERKVHQTTSRQQRVTKRQSRERSRSRRKSSSQSSSSSNSSDDRKHKHRRRSNYDK